ncbi:MAG: type II secretion system F family protein [Acidimicrobiales bacterium]
MDPVAVLFVALAAGGVVAVLAGVQAASVPVEGDAAAYLRSLDAAEEHDEYGRLLKQPFITRVLRPLGARTAGGLASLLPSNYRDGMHRKLLFAGMAGRVRAEELITAQFLLCALGAVAGLAVGWLLELTGGQFLFFLLFLPFIGSILPNVWLARAVDDRGTAIRKDLPDTLDLLAISVEAGMGFEGAMAIACEHFSSPLAEEFSRALQEMELGLPRRDALQNLKRRTNVPELSGFVLAIRQADALGMPLGRVLQTQATEMRNKRRQWARERAAKLPVKILFPMLPLLAAIFIVIGGPAVSEISRAFGG